MARPFVLFAYDRKNRQSVLEYAAELPGHRLVDFIGYEVIDRGGLFKGKPFKEIKGRFGQLLEQYYFGYMPNNSPEADFKEIGIELKSTYLKNMKKLGWQTNERLILNILDYTKVEKNCFNKLFMNKDSELLIVFYRKEGSVLEYLVDKVVLWKFNERELQIMREDWSKYEEIILDGRAHEITEGGTELLTLAPKGKNKNSTRPQPYSNIKAKQRALALKGSFLRKIYNEAPNLSEVLKNKTERKNISDKEEIFTELWGKDTTFEEAIIDKISKYRLKTCKEIEAETENLNASSKMYFSSLARRMLGVRKKRIAEFEDYDIDMKILRVKRNGNCKESTSFPAFDFVRVGTEPYEDSDLAKMMSRRYLFLVFQMTDTEDKIFKESRYLGAFFWSLPYKDLEEVKFVYNDTQRQIAKGIYNDFLKLSNTHVAHVRPHGHNGEDTSLGLDGNLHTKQCFWLNYDYMTKVISENIEVPLLSKYRRKPVKEFKRRKQ